MKFLMMIVMAFSLMAKEKIDAKSKAAMLKVLENNEALHAAYFDYNAAAVEKAKNTVVKSLASVKHKKVMALLKKSQKYLDQISAKASQDDNNKNYHLASVYMIRVMNNFDLGPKYAAYYCPMVKKKWIQNIEKDAKVNNPYDSSMPHCGGRL